MTEASHAQLWRVCHVHGLVFESWTENTDKPDCSTGCRFYHALEGDAGMDWGVCTNPESPRAGLLTFEHMGCEEYQYAPDDDDRSDWNGEYD